MKLDENTLYIILLVSFVIIVFFPVNLFKKEKYNYYKTNQKETIFQGWNISNFKYTRTSDGIIIFLTKKGNFYRQIIGLVPKNRTDIDKIEQFLRSQKNFSYKLVDTRIYLWYKTLGKDNCPLFYVDKEPSRTIVKIFDNPKIVLNQLFFYKHIKIDAYKVKYTSELTVEEILAQFFQPQDCYKKHRKAQACNIWINKFYCLAVCADGQTACCRKRSCFCQQ